MSIFSSALGGLGRASEDLADVWVREKSVGRLQDDMARLKGEIDAGKARLINELQLGRDATQQKYGIERDRLQTEGRTAAQKDMIEYQNSISVVEAEAEREAAIGGAKDRSTTRTTRPGDELVRDDESVFKNTHRTAAEIADERIRARAGGRATREVSADDKARISVYQNEVRAAEQRLREAKREFRQDINALLDPEKTSQKALKDPNSAPSLRLKKLEIERDTTIREMEAEINEGRTRIQALIAPPAAPSPAGTAATPRTRRSLSLFDGK